MRKTISLLVVFLCMFVPTVIFANTTTQKTNPVEISTKASPIQFKDDEYVRITQPVKDKTAVFDKNINVMGEARYGTLITIQLYNKKEYQLVYPRKAYRTYELDPVGISQTFNELIELQEGDNKIRLIYEYTNSQGDVIDDRIVIYITRKSEAEKEELKNLRINSPDNFSMKK